jgi:hypothetical protein
MIDNKIDQLVRFVHEPRCCFIRLILLTENVYFPIFSLGIHVTFRQDHFIFRGRLRGETGFVGYVVYLEMRKRVPILNERLQFFEDGTPRTIVRVGIKLGL